METTTLLPYASITTYDLKKNVRGRVFATEQAARDWCASVGSKCFNLYRIEKVNGTWRTDWQAKELGIA